MTGGPRVTDFHLAQLNVAHMTAPLDSPRLADFAAALDRINALADAAPGFVWRLIEAQEPALAAENPFPSDWLVNMSVWRDVESLRAYVYRSAHVEVMRLRAQWFHPVAEATLVLWWIPAGHRPTLVEASRRLQRLRTLGPGPEGFHFGRSWPPAPTDRG